MSGHTESSSNPSAWTATEFEEAWDMIPCEAQQILVELAQRPEGYSIKRLRKVFSTQSKRIQGTLSAVNRVHKKYRSKPRLVSRDLRGGFYTMDSTVAELIKPHNTGLLKILR